MKEKRKPLILSNQARTRVFERAGSDPRTLEVSLADLGHCP